MSIIAGYNDPIKIQLNYDNENNPISVEMQPESHVVLNGRITLIQIPDKFYRVQIDGFTELYEYDNSEIQSNNYRVDYQTGIIMLHNSLEGQTITVNKYWGRGIVLTPISRIYTRLENGNVVETLGQVIEDGSEALTAYGGIVQAINDAETKTTTLNNKILEGNTTEQNLDISILNADTKNTELNNTIDNANIVKNNLDNSITIGQQTKQDLDTSIANGDIQSIRDSVSDLAGEGRTVETVKGNYDEIESLKTQIEEPIYTTHTQGTPVASLPVGSLDGTVKDFKAEGLTRVNLIPSFHSWENLTLGLFNILSDYEAEMTISDGINKVVYVLLNVKPDTNYTFKVEHNGNIAIYNKDASMSIVTYTSNQEIKFNTGSHTQIRVYLRNAYATNGTYYFKNPILEEGTVVGDFIEGMKSVENPTVEIVGKNLEDIKNNKKLKSLSQASIKIEDGLECWNVINLNTLDAIIEGIFKENTQYTIQLTAKQVGTGNPRFRFIYTDGTFQDIFIPTTSFNRYIKTSDFGKTLVQIEYRYGSATHSLFISTEDFMLQEGTIATEYEPYKSSKLTANVPLRRVPNGVKDRLFYSNGALWLEKNVGEYVLKSEDITLLNTTKTNYDQLALKRIVIPNIYAQTNGITPKKMIIPNFNSNTLYGTGSFVDDISYQNTYVDSLSASTSIYLFIPKDKYATLQEAQTDLAGTVIQYQLAQPQLINLTEQGLTSGELMSFENGTVYNYSDTFHSPSISFDVPSNTASQITALLQSADLQAKAIESKANKVQEDWIEPTLLNGATAYGTPPSYFKDEFGMVHLRGLSKVLSLNTDVFILPVGYRPAGSQYYIGASWGGNYSIISITSTGVVQIRSNLGATFNSFDGISFLAEG